MSRHRGDDSAGQHHWWRNDDAAPARAPRRARTDDQAPAHTRQPEPRWPDPGPNGPFDTVVDPWTLLSPGAAAADWTIEHQAGRHASTPEPTGQVRGLTRITDRDTLDPVELTPAFQQAPTVRLDLREIAEARDAAEAAEATARSADRNAKLSAAATRFPSARTTTERGVGAYLRHTKILTGRQVRVVTRDRLTLLQSLLFPLLSMVMFKVVLGDAIGGATGQNSAYGTVPLVVLVGAMFGSLAVGTRLISERRTGLLTRLYVMPVHRGADLSSRIVAEMFRILVGTLVITTVGMLIGWRFDEGLLPALGIFAVALLYGAAYSTIVLTVAMSASNAPLVPIMSLCTSLLMFFNSGFSPVEAYPRVLRPLVENQPMTCAIETMRALAIGGPVAENLLKTIIWAVGALVIFAYPALRGYQRAAAARD